MKAILLASLAGAAITLASPATAQFASVDDPAPGYSSLMSSDYASAVREIREAEVSPYDPARSVNLGVALAKSGHPVEAAKQFRAVLQEDDVQFVVASGATLSSHEVARRALALLESGNLSR